MKFSLSTIALFSPAIFSNAFTCTPKTQSSSSLSMSINQNDEVSSRRNAIVTLLSTGLTFVAATPALARREPLPEYLTEPTDEFKESERLRDEFRRKQLGVKKQFNSVLDRLTFESKTEDELVTDLKELRGLVIDTEGLPLGIKKEELVKIIRAKKAKGFWPTPVEIAYQKLTSEIAYQQSPNREKDIANPL
mmetsp:Transcript_18840/g.21824  ORF Transcript_18840/g.21824 Transcript_18840/m.21824 type:complete len:192 (-) Transcript_18840:288-863(-)